MTLLIGTLSKNLAVLTADGLCRKRAASGEVVYLENHRKLWALPDRPIAFAHHGQNVIAGLDVWQFVEGHIARHTDEIANCSVGEIADLFIKWFDVEARTTLQHIEGDSVIGFWVVGFGDSRREPELHEILWPNPTSTRRENLTIGGTAQCLLKSAIRRPMGSFRLERLPSAKEKYALAYHNWLYRIAEQKQRKEDLRLFGGHKHQLVILRSGWHWEKVWACSC